MMEFLVDTKKEVEKVDNYIYLELGEVAYSDEFKYAKGESVMDRIRALLEEVPGSKEARMKMSVNVEELQKRLSKEDEDVSFDDFLKQTIKDIILDAAVDGEKNKVNDLLAFLETKGQLFSHLDETREATVSFFDNIKEIISDDPETGLLKKRHVLLMEFVAKTHDLPKLLGALNAQIDPDHEVIYREVVCKNLVGRSYKTQSGETVVFDEDDVRFIKAVTGMHEDIWREDQFAEQSKSLDKKIAVTDKIYIERARCIFHFIDIFGKAVNFDEHNNLTIVDQVAFKNRFIDLYQRHIKLPISPNLSGEVDWTKGKVNRAEWGLHGVTGLTWTFEGLTDWGIKVDPNLVKEIQQGIVGVLKNAKRSLKDAIGSQHRYTPNETSKNNLRRNYRKVSRILAELKKEVE